MNVFYPYGLGPLKLPSSMYCSLADLNLILLRTMWGLKRNLSMENNLTVGGQKAEGYRMKVQKILIHPLSL